MSDVPGEIARLIFYFIFFFSDLHISFLLDNMNVMRGKILAGGDMQECEEQAGWASGAGQADVSLSHKSRYRRLLVTLGWRLWELRGDEPKRQITAIAVITLLPRGVAHARTRGAGSTASDAASVERGCSLSPACWAFGEPRKQAAVEAFGVACEGKKRKKKLVLCTDRVFLHLMSVVCSWHPRLRPRQNQGVWLVEVLVVYFMPGTWCTAGDISEGLED